MNLQEIKQNLLNQKELIALSTDTIPGLVALANNFNQIEEIYNFKTRPKDKPLALLVSSFEMAEKIVEIPETAKNFINLDFSVTIICNQKENCALAKNINQIDNSFALRQPKNKKLQALIKDLGTPLVATSVNKSKQDPLVHLKEVTERYPQIITYNIGDGNNQPSAIIDFREVSAKITRATTSQREQIERFI